MMKIKNILAWRCEVCPLCKYARKNPESLMGKAMAWHGKFCPAWRAWQEIYGDKAKDQS